MSGTDLRLAALIRRFLRAGGLATMCFTAGRKTSRSSPG